MNSEGKGRLARWAERKAAVKRRGGAAPVIPEEPADVPATRAEQPEEAEATPPDKDPRGGDAELPDVESLDAESDFTVFMKDGVPAELRRLALRKLWTSDPMFNVIDEMVEYGEDYTNAATVVAGMKSAWEAGRGYLDRKTTGEKGADETAAAQDAQDRNPDPSDGEERTVSDDSRSEDEPRERG